MNVINRLHLDGWKDIAKRFLRIFLPLAIFFGSLTVLFYFKDVKTAMLNVQKAENYKINSQVKAINAKFGSISTDLNYLVSQRELLDYLDSNTPSRREKLIDELKLYTFHKEIYRQIQFIDQSGNEQFRVFAGHEKPPVTSTNKLENHSEQDYFAKARTLTKGNVLISPFALVNDNQAEANTTSLIRFSTPVFDRNGKHQGVYVLSHPVSFLLKDTLSTSPHFPGLLFLVNSSGEYLGGKPEDVDSLLLPEVPQENIEDIIGEAWQQIRQQQSGQLVAAPGLITFSTIYPLQEDNGRDHQSSSEKAPISTQPYLWKIVSFVPDNVLNEWPEKILGRILLLYSVCVVIIGVSSFMLARTSIRRQKAEQAMRENEEELRAINEAAANAIIAIDNNKNVLHWNPAAERLFQYTATEVVEKPITSIISPPKHQSSFTKISRKFKLPVDTDSMEAKTIELYGYKKDGTEFPVEVSFSAFKKGDQWHTVGIIRDISARKMMEKEVLRANKYESLGVLSSGIAHDFNNLLTAIIGNVNLVRKLSGVPADCIDLLKNAEKASRRAKALTQQLLTFSKEGMPIRKTTAIDKLVHDAAEFALHGSAIVCSKDIPDDLLLVDIDGGQIGQVLQNLITNSRQAIKSSGTIHLQCRNVEEEEIREISENLSGRYIAIAIRDNGQGIAEKDQSKIFDPYFTTKENGSGLGLTIAQSIIQRHDGRIIFDSTENKGSSFTVYLPAAVDQHLPKEEEKKRGKGKSFRIMVVDSEEMLLSIAGRMLVHLGHECVCARSALEALDTYKHLWKTGSPVDGVIVDLTLPGGMGGKETAAAIFDVNSEARIIVSSGYTNDPVMVDFDEYGFCAAITKPFDMDELADVIETVLE